VAIHHDPIRRAAHTRVRDGADSFVIEDGWIVAWTIHYTVEDTITG
jgi:hypothetical protein